MIVFVVILRGKKSENHNKKTRAWLQSYIYAFVYTVVLMCGFCNS